MNDQKEYDVIVAGRGPAGLGAVLAASKLGARTLLIEGAHNFGCVAKKAMIMPFNRVYVNGKPRGGVI